MSVWEGGLTVYAPLGKDRLFKISRSRTIAEAVDAVAARVMVTAVAVVPRVRVTTVAVVERVMVMTVAVVE